MREMRYLECIQGWLHTYRPEPAPRDTRSYWVGVSERFFCLLI